MENFESKGMSFGTHEFINNIPKDAVVTVIDLGDSYKKLIDQCSSESQEIHFDVEKAATHSVKFATTGAGMSFDIK